MPENDVQGHIEELVAEEHRLQKAGEGGGMDPERHERLEAVRVELDRLWDLLRQRRAARSSGSIPTTRRSVTPTPSRATSSRQASAQRGQRALEARR